MARVVSTEAMELVRQIGDSFSGRRMEVCIDTLAVLILIAYHSSDEDQQSVIREMISVLHAGMSSERDGEVVKLN